MKLKTGLFVPAAIVFLTVAISSQQKPNFSGRWVVVGPPDAAGEEQTVKQDVKTLSTEHASEGPGHKTTYKLDGTESRNVIASHGSDIVTMSKAVWK